MYQMKEQEKTPENKDFQDSCSGYNKKISNLILRMVGQVRGKETFAEC